MSALESAVKALQMHASDSADVAATLTTVQETLKNVTEGLFELESQLEAVKEFR